LHAWLWLPQVQSRPAWVRVGILAAGFIGPLVLVGSFASRYGLGLDAPWYLAELVALHYVSIPTFVIGLAWLAVSAQFAALVAGRYGPYPDARNRRIGPIRSLVRHAVLAQRARTRSADEKQRAAGG
jgi:hypothetical protein